MPATWPAQAATGCGGNPVGGVGGYDNDGNWMRKLLVLVEGALLALMALILVNLLETFSRGSYGESPETLWIVLVFIVNPAFLTCWMAVNVMRQIKADAALLRGAVLVVSACVAMGLSWLFHAHLFASVALSCVSMGLGVVGLRKGGPARGPHTST